MDPTSARAGSDGYAYTTLILDYIQPGNNWVVQAYGPGGSWSPGCYGVSPMLTVWRRLHIETDSMGAVTGNQVTGNIVSVTYNPSAERYDSTVENVDPTDALDDGSPEPGRFQGGALRDAEGFLCPVLGQDPAVPDVLWLAAEPALGAFLLVDDDMNLPPLSGGPTSKVVLPHYPDTGWMQDADDWEANRFAQAYIRPEYGIAQSRGWNQADAEFKVVVPGYHSEIVEHCEPYAQGRDTLQAGFWYAYVQTAYQAHGAWEDNDPDIEGPHPLKGVTGVDAAGQHAYSLVYLETLRDCTEDVQEDAFDLTSGERKTVAHEVARHLVGSLSDLGLMRPCWPRAGEIDPEWPYFAPLTLHWLRLYQGAPR